MAESADALDSGSSRGNSVQVQVLLPAPSSKLSNNAGLDDFLYNEKKDEEFSDSSSFGFWVTLTVEQCSPLQVVDLDYGLS